MSRHKAAPSHFQTKSGGGDHIQHHLQFLKFRIRMYIWGTIFISLYGKDLKIVYSKLTRVITTCQLRFRCYSKVGKTGGVQALSFGKGCFQHPTLVHELGHSIGFFHEHTRSDRDDYLNIHWSEIMNCKFGINMCSCLLWNIKFYENLGAGFFSRSIFKIFFLSSFKYLFLVAF